VGIAACAGGVAVRVDRRYEVKGDVGREAALVAIEIVYQVANQISGVELIALNTPYDDNGTLARLANDCCFQVPSLD
jgi:hypothetical protein